jgi:hypothetical protein
MASSLNQSMARTIAIMPVEFARFGPDKRLRIVTDSRRRLISEGPTSMRTTAFDRQKFGLLGFVPHDEGGGPEAKYDQIRPLKLRCRARILCSGEVSSFGVQAEWGW